MPLVRISLREGKDAAYRRAVADSVHDAMVATIGIPKDDRFQVVTEHAADGLIYDPDYLGIKRTDDVVFVQITMSTGRTVEIKKALFAKIVENLAKRAGVRKEDVFVNLVEVAKENWSFGNGEAQYAV
jgi:phenylpyruvate tautomerase PptA (4-oxalocrotonate tautomerase family)